MSCVKWLMAALFAIEVVTPSTLAGERPGAHDILAVPAKAIHSGRTPAKDADLTVAPLDRVAGAVDRADSSHGRDMAMWR